MSKIINAGKLESYVGDRISLMVGRNYKGRRPKLVIIQASDDKASGVYIRNKVNPIVVAITGSSIFSKSQLSKQPSSIVVMPFSIIILSIFV